MNKKLIALFIAILCGVTVLYAQSNPTNSTSPAAPPSTNRTMVDNTNPGHRTRPDSTTNTSPPSIGTSTNTRAEERRTESTSGRTNLAPTDSADTNKSTSRQEVSTSTNETATSTRPTGASTAVSTKPSTNAPASASMEETITNSSANERPISSTNNRTETRSEGANNISTTNATPETRPSSSTNTTSGNRPTGTTEVVTEQTERRGDTNQQRPASEGSREVPKDDLTQLYTVTIPFAKRSYYKTALEKIIDDEELLELALEMNDKESIEENEEIVMLVPLEKDKDGTFLYEYTIEKNDIIADISYLFYEEYKWKEFFDYNTIPVIYPGGGQDSYYYIEIDDSLMIPIDDKNVIDFDEYELKTDMDLRIDEDDKMPMPGTGDDLKDEMVSIDDKPEVPSPAQKLLEMLAQTINSIEEEVILYAQTVANDYYVVQFPMDDRSEEANDVLEEVLDDDSEEYELAILINDNEEIVDVLDSMYVPLDLTEKKGKYFYKYTVKKNDTLSKIAGWFYNDVYEWETILDYNDVEKVRDDYYLIEIGDELLIPIDENNIVTYPMPISIPDATTTQPAGSLSTNQPPARTASTNQPAERTTSTNQPPARTASTNQPAERTTSTNQPPARTASTNQPAERTTSTNQPPATESETISATEDSTDSTATEAVTDDEQSQQVNNMLEDYANWVNEYSAFLEQYNANPDDENLQQQNQMYVDAKAQWEANFENVELNEEQKDRYNELEIQISGDSTSAEMGSEDTEPVAEQPSERRTENPNPDEEPTTNESTQPETGSSESTSETGDDVSTSSPGRRPTVTD